MKYFKLAVENVPVYCQVFIFSCHITCLIIYSFFIDYNNIGKFLNRILGMEVHQQNALFQNFADTLSAVIQNAKKTGRYDMGILGK